MAGRRVSNPRILTGWIRTASLLWLAFILGMTACSQKTEAPSTGRVPSAVSVSVTPAGPATIRTPAAEFEVLPSGYIRAGLREGNRVLTLDEPGAEPAVWGQMLSAGKIQGGEPEFNGNAPLFFLF